MAWLAFNALISRTDSSGAQENYLTEGLGSTTGRAARIVDRVSNPGVPRIRVPDTGSGGYLGRTNSKEGAFACPFYERGSR